MKPSNENLLSLDTLTWVAQAFGFGLMRSNQGVLEAINSTMKRFQRCSGDLGLFNDEASIEAPLRVKGEAGEDCFFVVKRHEVDDDEALIVVQEVTAIKSSEQRLCRANQLIETVSEERNVFLSHLGHELRSPLNSIIVLSQMLAKRSKETLSERQLKSVEMINRSGNQLLTLIGDVVDLAKVEQGILSAEVGEVNVRAVLESNLKALLIIAESKKIAVNVEVEEGLPEVIESDPYRLGQIIRVLVDNGIKFTRQGSVDINVFQSDADAMHFEIKDSGMGMAPEVVAALSEEFRQNKSAAGSPSCAGLGLNLVRNLTGLIRASLQVKSESGKGSCFTLTVPIRWPEEGAAAALLIESTRNASPNHSSNLKPDSECLDEPVVSALSVVAEQNPHAEGVFVEKPDQNVVDRHIELKSKKVLLVEKDIRHVFALMGALEPFDFEVTVAQSGEDALDKLDERCCPDFVVIDSQLSSMNGFETIEKIRQQLRWRDLPVIAVLDSEDEEGQCCGAGVTDFLAKPIDVNLLVSKMSAAIRLGQRQ